MAITSKITNILPISNYELILSNIVAILTVELSNQLTLLTAQIAIETNPATKKALELYKASIPSKVYESCQMAADENSFLNVRFLQSLPNKEDELNSHSIQSGNTKYIIECWQRADTTVEMKGDQRASKKLHRLLGACRKILMDKRHYDLGAEIGTVTNKIVTNISEYIPEKTSNQNADNEVYGMFELNCTISESVENTQSIILSGMDSYLEEINGNPVPTEWEFNETI